MIPLMVKIDLKNPITCKEVNRMIQKILKISKQSLLIIDFGNHNFESIEVLKFCKKELINIETKLLKFNKIAFLTIPPYKSESQDSSKLKYFHLEEKAKEWILSET
jgi:hypothetical protein